MANSEAKSRFRFRLRTLVIVITLIAAGFGGYRAFVAPYLLQNEIRLAIEEAGGSYEMRPAPEWVRFLCGDQNVCVLTKVDLAADAYFQGSDLIHFCDYVWPGNVTRGIAKRELLQQLAKLEDLRELNVACLEVDDELVGSWDRLRQLEVLVLSNTLVKNPGRWPEFPRLKLLDVSLTDVNDQTAVALPRYSQLTHLSLDQTQLTDVGFFHLRQLPTLETLYVAETGVTEASASVLRELPRLDVLCAGLNQSRVQRALRPGRSRKLQFPLEIKNGESAGDGIIIGDCLERRLPKNFRIPWIPGENGGISLGALEARQLHRLSENQAQLTFLNLSATYVADDDLKHLAGLPNLHTLYFRDTWITDAGLRHLASCKQLRVLYLHRTMIEGHGLADLARCPRLERLRVDFNLRGEALKHLRRIPNLQVVTFGDPDPSGWRAWHHHRLQEALTIADVRNLNELARQIADNSVGTSMEDAYRSWFDQFQFEDEHADLEKVVCAHLLSWRKVPASTLREFPQVGRWLPEIQEYAIRPLEPPELVTN